MMRRWLGIVLGLTICFVVAWQGLSWLEKSYQTPYTLIEDGLYLGGATEQPPPSTQVVLNLCGRKDAYSVDVYRMEPILEGGAPPTVDWLREMAEFIADQRHAERVVYVHCMAGQNRSASVVVAYLMFEHSWSCNQAIAFVQSKRPEAYPNPEMVRLLEEWEKALTSKSEY